MTTDKMIMAVAAAMTIGTIIERSGANRSRFWFLSSAKHGCWDLFFEKIWTTDPFLPKLPLLSGQIRGKRHLIQHIARSFR